MSKEYLISLLVRMDNMLYRHVSKTHTNKYKAEPAGYSRKLRDVYNKLDLLTLSELYLAKSCVLTIEKM
jgi:hypothetical protein